MLVLATILYVLPFKVTKYEVHCIRGCHFDKAGHIFAHFCPFLPIWSENCLQINFPKVSRLLISYMNLIIPTERISWHFKFTKLRQLLNIQLSIWNPLIYILISYITFYKLVSVMYPHIWVWAVHDCVTYFSCSGNDVTFFCSLFVVYGNMGYWVSKEGIKNQYKKGIFMYFVTELQYS